MTAQILLGMKHASFFFNTKVLLLKVFLSYIQRVTLEMRPKTQIAFYEKKLKKNTSK